MVNTSRRRSSVSSKTIAETKADRRETTEEIEAEKNKNISRRQSLASQQTAKTPQDAGRQTSGDTALSLERKASSVQASVPSRKNSVTTSHRKEVVPQKSSDILANKDNALESQLNKTSLTSIPNQANLSEPQSEETNSNMARAYGKYQSVKDTPSHLYGLDGALISSDEDTDVDMEDSFRDNNQSHLVLRLKSLIKNNWKGALGGISIFLITGIFLAYIIQVLPSWTSSREPENDPNSLTLKKIEEKVDKLSSVLQIIANSADSSSDNKSVISEKAVQQIVQKALERYNADKVGMADFALESSGAQIHGSHHSATYDIGAARVVLFGIPLWFDIKPPRVILQRDNSPGNCWAFKGEQGYVVIKLSKMLTPTAFSLEHIPKSLSPTGDGRIPSAPKEFTIWAWKDPDGNERVKLGYYIFDSEGDFLQTFNVQLTNQTEIAQFIELRILSNHGNPEYTCIYRFRVHGTPHL